MKKLILHLFILIMLLSCNKEKLKGNENNFLEKKVSSRVKVNITTIQNNIFNKQLVANGKVEATQKSELRFKVSGELFQVNVKNGQIVVKDQILTSLENKLITNQLEKAKIDLNKALNKLQEEKINYGLIEGEKINSSILESLQMKSGYFEAKNALENIQIRYNQTILRALFTGIIANVKVKTGYYVSTSDVFCTLINPNKLEAVFSISENELSFVSKGQEIIIQTFSNSEKKYKGIISEINPLVDENGLIQLKASIQTKNIQLFDGMNIKVYINKPKTDVIVIPKEALVLRSNREVVFTMSNGLTKWNYVTKLDENSTQYAIKKGENLKSTDTIIISGNLNLSHDIKVNATFVLK